MDSESTQDERKISPFLPLSPAAGMYLTVMYNDIHLFSRLPTLLLLIFRAFLTLQKPLDWFTFKIMPLKKYI